MTDESGNGRRRADADALTKFKWIVVAALLALVLILGTIQEIVK